MNRLLALTLALTLGIVLGTASLAAAEDAPPKADATRPAPIVDVAAFARGAKAWATHCARCHALRDPKDLSDTAWRVSVTHMRLRAGLDGRDARDITLFLQGSN